MSNLIHYVGYSVSRTFLYLGAGPFQRNTKKVKNDTVESLEYLGFKKIDIIDYFYSIYSHVNNKGSNKYRYYVQVQLYNDEDIYYAESKRFKEKLRMVNSKLKNDYDVYAIKIRGAVLEITYSSK